MIKDASRFFRAIAPDERMARIVSGDRALHAREESSGANCLFGRFARRAILGRLRRLRHGRLCVIEAGRMHEFGRPDAACDLDIRLEVLDPCFWRDVALAGTVGVGESYMSGYWRVSDLPGLVRLFLVNRDAMDELEGGTAWLARPLHNLLHALRKNTREGARRNIAAHYDLGNEFFALFLDETMMYSAGIYERPESTLLEASTAKNERICRKLDLSPDDHVVEIGTGWGGFALHAASRFGCRVTTTTISRNQFEFATRRVREAGLADRVTVLLNDYRELRGQFDKLVSIEMIEAVGHHYYDAFFETCARLLKPEGQMLIQAIVIRDHLYQQARDSVDFIKNYIFPGCCIPSVSALQRAMGRSSDLRLFHAEDLTAHYARTLADWRARFMARLDDVRALGYSDMFIRMWEFYLAYCEGGFAEHAIADMQLLYARPRCRRAPLLPALDPP